MSADQEPATGPSAPTPQRPEDSNETLTDLMDRMDREAFRRALEQRDLHVLATTLRPQR
jgi:hypothetical protein